jgi:hypothetical protein
MRAVLEAIADPDASRAAGAGAADIADAAAGGRAGAERRGVASTEPSEPRGSTGVPLDDDYLQARLALDGATLRFLSLPRKQRKRLLDAHSERQQADSEEAREIVESERRARATQRARREALDAARRARSAAHKRVEQEKARLLGLRSRYLDRETQLLAQRQALAGREGAKLEWRERVETMVAKARGGEVERSEVDILYDELVTALGRARAGLVAALGRLEASRDRDVEPLGNDPLADLDVDAEAAEVRALRRELGGEERELWALSTSLAVAEASALAAVVRALSENRFTLLAHLSANKRRALHGFAAEARAQAHAELDQMLQILRYHVAMARRWAAGFSLARYDRDTKLLVYWRAFQALALVSLFVWWLRRADRFLAAWRQRERETKNRRRVERALFFARRIQRPVALLLLFWLLRELLPSGATDLLEVTLLETVLVWTLAEALVVDAVDALFSGRQEQGARARSEARLRLQSLRLIGRVIVLFGLSLSLGAQLVGKGTIYHWVELAAWASTLPVALVLVSWHRPLVFERIERRRSKSRFLEWIHEHRHGWLSLAAATAGAAYLLLHRANLLAQSYVTDSALGRRLVAYLSRRELSRERPSGAVLDAGAPLAAAAQGAFDPDVAADRRVPSSADAQIEAIVERVEAPGGGVFAIVGERGIGKTTLLGRIGERCRAVVVGGGRGGVDALLGDLGRALGVEEGCTAESIRDVLGAPGPDQAILIDDAHRLLFPVIGGIADFDRLVALARDASASRWTWVLVLDAVMFRYLVRARGARPLFDEVIELSPWTEDEIELLLRERSKSAGVAPSFEGLVPDLPLGADEYDRNEALERVENRYFRLLWDYADGNPGVALHFWRSSLTVDDGGTVRVSLFVPPDVGDIERLPDDAVFVLRAVVQLERARVDDVVAAMMLPADRVRDALRYARARGYVETGGERYRIH